MKQLTRRMRTTRLWRGLASQAGYTLVEMVVLIGIMGVLSALVVANTKVGDKRQELRDAANQFVSAAKHAESMAAASEVVEDPTASATDPLKKASRKAYGICLSSSPTAACKTTGSLANYQLYVRDAASGSDLAATNNAILIKNYPLPPNVQFSNPLLGFPLGWVDYVPPQPKMTVNGLDTQRPDTKIVLSSSKDAGYPQTVVARPAAGVVYVQ